MSAYLMNEQMLSQMQHYNNGYQQMLMRAALCNYTEVPVALPAPPELLDCEMELLNVDLWKQFHALGTEMIITKNGRRMFPSLSISIKGLKTGEQYAVAVEMVPVGNARWRRSGGAWVEGAGGPASGGIAPGAGAAGAAAGVALHPDGPAPASRWSQPVNFNRLKLTNNVHDNSGNIVLTSMCKYQSRIRVMRTGGGWPAEKCFTFPETEFIAVTAYQNEQITQLKIDNNPFAKGFRKCGQGRCKRKMRPELTESENHTDGTSSPKTRSSDASSLHRLEDSGSDHDPHSPESVTTEIQVQDDLSVDKDEQNAIQNRLSNKSPNTCCKTEMRQPERSYEANISIISRSSVRSPSISSESSYPLSVGSCNDEAFPQKYNMDTEHSHKNDWSQYMAYVNPMFVSHLGGIIPAYSHPSFMTPLPLWYRPPHLMQALPSPPMLDCRPRESPKGSSFTIRALIGEN